MKTDTKQQTKHTPGPWTVDACYIHGPSGKRFLAVAGDDEGKANARLIAAAPDLLAFAKWAKETLIGDSGAAWSHWGQFPEFRAGMKAIEKAEGQS